MSTLSILNETVSDAVYKLRQRNYWKGSFFEEIVQLSNDERGKWGEQTLFKFIKELTDYNVEWDEDQNINNDDGVYDLWINRPDGTKIRIEVKTASRGTGNKSNWQHENLYSSEKWDKLVFIDFEYSAIWFTVLDYSEVTFDSRHDIFGTKPTLRNDQNDKYKWDFRDKQVHLGVANGYTFCYDVNNTDDEQFSSFLKKKLA
jgi:hypothetical protein